MADNSFYWFTLAGHSLKAQPHQAEIAHRPPWILKTIFYASTKKTVI